MLNWRESLSKPPATPQQESRIGTRGLHTHTHRDPPVQHDILGSFIKLIYPTYCCQCQKVGRYLCPTCFEFIHFTTGPLGLRLERNYVDGVSSMAAYAEPLSSALHAMKYHSVKGITAWCAELLYMHCQIPSADLIVPVPISKQRWRERGFNQAEEIARHLSEKIQIPYENVLFRKKHTSPQARVTDQSQRKTRMENIFAVKTTWQQKLPKTVLLIDDVVTTGATLNECAKVLKANGVTTVNAIAIAHGQ